MVDQFIRKRTALVLFLFLFYFSSCSSPCRNWEISQAKSDCPSINYTKVNLLPCSTFDEVEAEYLRYNNYLYLYLNTVILQFPSSDSQGLYSTVNIRIDENEEYTFMALRLQGGQRLLLPDEAQELVTYQLFNGFEVQITIGRYNTTLIPANFPALYSQIN